MTKQTPRLSSTLTGWRRIALIGAVVLWLTTTVQAQTTGARLSKSIVFLSSYQIDLPVNTLAVQAIQDEFQQAADLNPNIYYEYLDINRFPDAAYQQTLFDLFALKYRDKPVDLVIVGSSIMLELWLSKRADILPNTPALFYDINTAKAATLTLPPDVSGVTADVDFVKSARWFLQTRPDVNEMILVHGVGKADQAFLPYVDAVRAELCGTVQCADWSSLPLPEMTRRAAALPNTSVIVYFLLMEDAAGVKYKPIDVIRQLTAVSSAPVLSGYDQFIGTGTIGGYMYSIEAQARAVTRMGLRILRGEPVSAMPVQINTGTQFVFDHHALRRWNIPLSALPAESMIKNRRYSVWEQYRLPLIGASVGVAILILLTGYLWILTRRLHAARQILSQSNVNLDIQVRERTAALNQANHRLEEENVERKWAEEKLRKSEERYQSFIAQSFEGISRTEFDQPVDIALPIETQIDAIYEHAYMAECNLALAQMYRLPSAEALIGTRLIDAHNGKDNPINRAAFRRFIENDYKSINDETVEYDANGEPIWFLSNTIGTIEHGYLVRLWGTAIEITERKRAEEALRESEARWQFALEGSGDGVWDWDAQSNTVFFSNQWKTMFGFEPHEIGNSLSEWDSRIHPDDRDPVYAAIQQHFDGQTPIYMSEHRVRCKDGAYKWILDRGKVISRTPDGKPLRVIGTHTDISARKQAEQILQESEAKYRRLVENLPGIVYVFSSARGSVYCSTHVETILGYPPEYLYLHPQIWNQSIHPDDAPKVTAVIRQFRQGEHFAVEYRIKNAAGAWRWLYDLSIGRQDLPDETLIEGLALDITDRKRAEEELRLFKSIVESSEEAIAISDAAGHLVYINPAHERLFGRSLEQARQADYREYYPPESVEMLNREVAPALACGQSWQGVLDVFDASGRRFPLWEHADSICDADGKMLYGFGFMHDDTLRKNVEDTLKQAKSAAEEANRIKSAFFTNMNHELRTPLNSMLGYTQILRRDPTISAEQLKGLNIIEQSGNYLLDLINDILDLAKIEAGRLEVHPAPIHLPSLLDDVRGMMAVKAEHNGLRLQLIQDPRLPDYVEADAHRLRQILLNLLGNAIKFTDRGDVTLRVTTDSPRPLTEDASGCSAAQPPDSPPGRGKGWVADDWQQLSVTNPPLPLPGGECVASPQNMSLCPTLPAGELARLRFDIEDSGVGIAPDDLAKLFTPFQQVGDTARRAQGTGLGLAISRNLAALMGGTLTVTSAVGVGSVFRFEVALPVVASADSQTSPPKPAQEEMLSPVAPAAAETLPSPAMLKTLFDLADIGDILGLRANLTALAQSEGGLTPFVERLQELAQHFQLGQIRQILLRSLEEANRRHADALSDTERAAAIPAEWLARLRNAIAVTDIQAIDHALRDMRTIDPGLADTLAQLAYDFEYDKMTNLLEHGQS